MIRKTRRFFVSPCHINDGNLKGDRHLSPGTFIVPPAKAEQMYSPEVFGRSSSAWVIVK